MRKIRRIVLIALFFCTLQYVSAQEAITPINISSASDISKILAQVGTKRIVAIGEDTHGTKEFYELRTALTKRLILEKGFSIFILENPHEDMMTLHRDLFSKPLDTLMKRHLFSIYQTAEMKAFLTWLKGYIRTHPSFDIAGADDSYREILPAALKKEIKLYKNSKMNDLADDFEHRQLMNIEEYYSQPGIAKPDSLPDDLRFGYDTYNNLVQLDSLYHIQKKKSPAVEELIFHAKSNYIIYSYFSRNKYLSRDEMMGMRVNYYAAKKNAKIIVWAHSGHMAKSALDKEIGLMGATIAKENKGNYFAIGLSTSEGSYSYLKNRFINDDHVFADSLFHTSFLETEKDSWNGWFAQQSSANFWINFTKLNAADSALYSSKKPFRIIGYQRENPDKKNKYFTVPVSSLYDVLIFLRKTNPTTALFYR